MPPGPSSRSRRLSASLADLATSPPARRLAQLWESIAKLEERPNRTLALANAAISYEIAGYQANAACLARLLSRSLPADGAVVERLTALFLQRRLLLANALAVEAMREPAVLTEPSIWAASANALAAKGMAQSTRYLLCGDDAALVRAGRLFELAWTGFESLGLAREAVLVRSLVAALAVLAASRPGTTCGRCCLGTGCGIATYGSLHGAWTER